MNTAIPDRYLLAADFEKRAVDFKFPAGVWNVAAALAEVSEATSASELERLTQLSSAQVREAIERLLAKQLVRQNLISWKEFSVARDRALSSPKPAVEAVSQVAAAKVASVATMPTDKATPAQGGVAMRLGTISPQPSTSGTTNAWLMQRSASSQVAVSKPATPTTPVTAATPPAAAAAAPSAEPANGRLLRPLLAQIENVKGGGVEGQLLVYQVFLRVPYQLLHDEGIKSLHFVDEHTVIQNPVLLAAIVKAAKDVAGVDLK